MAGVRPAAGVVDRPWVVPLAVAALTALGFAIRLSNLGQGLLGDEQSTTWIVEGHSLGHVLSTVHGDAEISPPLYFILAWLMSKISSSPEWLRVPSLIAGTATIPIVYAIGARTLGRVAGLLAGAVVTLSPVLIYYSTEARSYAVMMAFVAGSTLAMLVALDSGRRRWWVAYAALSCLAMYSHYTAAFPLIAQVLWLLWAHPEARVVALLANVGAAIAYIPWIPGYIADTNSVTIPIVNVLLPFTFRASRLAIEQWGMGYPYVPLHDVPGAPYVIMMGIGMVIAAIAVLVRAADSVRRSGGRLVQILVRVPRRAVLVAMLALAAPVGEAIYSAFGTHLLGTRDLNSSWPGLALVIGGLLAAAGPVVGVMAAVLVLGGYGVGAVKASQSRWARPDYPAVARFIEDRWHRRDVVVDTSILSVVPLTSLDIALPQTHREFRIDLPKGPPPYTGLTPIPPAKRLIGRAIAESRGSRMFVVVGGVPGGPGGIPGLVYRIEHSFSEANVLLRSLPPGYRVVEARSYPGLGPLSVLVIDGPGVKDQSGGSGRKP